MRYHLYNILIIVSVLFVFGSCEAENKEISEPNQVITFTELSTGNPVIDSLYSQAVAVVDLNNDYYPEMYVTNSWKGDHNHFYKNENGFLKKDNSFLFAQDSGFSNGCSFVDIDNNGIIDLCVANFENEPNSIYFGNKSGGYDKKRLQSNESWSYGASFADVDNDGKLELYITNHHQQQNHFYKIEKQQFLKIESSKITNERNSSFNAAWSDLNNDGFQDLIVCNDSVNELYQNLGDFKFKQMHSDLTMDTTQTYGCSIADYNNDGLMDIFIVNFIGKNWLYKNLGEFTFEKIIFPFNGDYNYSEGSCWGDYNNDGYTDLCVTNDGTNLLYKNIEGKKFEKQLIKGFSDSSRNSNGVVWVDYDLDGDLDLFLANGGNQRNQFFKNSGNDNNWIKVKLEGTSSNRSAIGARVTVYSGNLIQHQEVQSQSGGGCGSQKQLLLHFGLGSNIIVDSIQIDWPVSVPTTKYTFICNNIYTLKE